MLDRNAGHESTMRLHFETEGWFLVSEAARGVRTCRRRWPRPRTRRQWCARWCCWVHWTCRRSATRRPHCRAGTAWMPGCCPTCRPCCRSWSSPVWCLPPATQLDVTWWLLTTTRLWTQFAVWWVALLLGRWWWRPSRLPSWSASVFGLRGFLPRWWRLCGSESSSIIIRKQESRDSCYNERLNFAVD